MLKVVSLVVQRRAAVWLLSSLAAWDFHVHQAAAQNRTWSPLPVDTNWLNEQNWIPAGVPTIAETALITSSGTIDVALSESQSVGRLTLGGAQGAQTLLVSDGAVLTLAQNGAVQGTGILVLQSARVEGALMNSATIQLRQGTLSSLATNSGLLEAIDSENAVENGFFNSELGTIRVRAEAAPAVLTYGNMQSPQPPDFGNPGRIEVISASGQTARLVLAGNLVVLENGVVSLAGGPGSAVLDVDAATSDGLIMGHGELTGGLTNEDLVRVGAPLGTLRIGGDFSQSSTASLELEIAGATASSQYDVLEAAGAATLAGHLVVDVLNGYEPPSGEEFAIIRRAGGSGQFDTVQVSGLAEHGFSIAYHDDAVVMQFASGEDILSGDFNGNLRVEQADLDLVLLNWGDAGRTPIGWINDLPDGLVDQNELDRVLLNWGNTSPPGSQATGVPEPAAVALILLAAMPWALPMVRYVYTPTPTSTS